jgi:hypothetical protein
VGKSEYKHTTKAIDHRITCICYGFLVPNYHIFHFASHSKIERKEEKTVYVQTINSPVLKHVH